MEMYIRINVDNASFEGDGLGKEIARMLRKLAVKLARSDRDDVLQFSKNMGLGVLRDINGNAVGTVDLLSD